MITGKEIWGMMNGNYSNLSSGNLSGWHGMWSGMGTGGSAWAAPAAFAWGLVSFFVGIAFLGIWIYTSFAYMGIARKMKYKRPWLAWIPFARGAMILQLGSFPWGWVFLWSPLLLLPLSLLHLGIGARVLFIALAFSGALAFNVLCYISHWRFFEKRGYYGWLALVPLVGLVAGYLSFLAGIAFLVILGFVAWKNGKMVKARNSGNPRRPNARSLSRSSRRNSGRGSSRRSPRSGTRKRRR